MPLLEAFLKAGDDQAATEALGRLLDPGILQVIRRTVTHELARSRRAASAIDDVVADVQMRLVARLQAWRAGEDDPIDNIPGYARTLAIHACYGVLRREFPERTRLRNKIRYILTHHPDLALDTDAAGHLVARLTSLRRAAASGSTRAWLDDPIGVSERLGFGPATPIPSLLTGVLSRCDVPPQLDDLVDGLARVLGIADAAPAATSDDGNGAGVEVASSEPDIGEVLEQREALSQVWTELLDLPPRQRAALLLNLRDTDGSALIQTLPATGIADKSALARALGITTADLDLLWPDLPLDDLRVAARLGITRQQVINLRKSGRARLARRLAPVIQTPLQHQSEGKAL